MQISPSERESSQLDTGSLEIACRQLREIGYVVLKSVFEPGWIAELFDQYLDQAKYKYGKQWPNNHGGISPPMKEPFLDPLIVQNPFAMQILKMTLGDNFFSYLPYGNNTAWPNCSIQHIHRDAGHLFPDTPYVLPMTKAVINIPLVDFTEKNGATEVWPSSHLMVDRPEDSQLSLEKRVQSLASVRMLIPAGSLVIRDMRCWHRGMPNKTAQPRPMLALVYFRRFHHEPDNSTIFRYTLPEDNWQSLPDIGKNIYRFNQPYKPD